MAFDKYILGEEYMELHRLGIQHEVWSETTQKAWNKAGFCGGMTLLDVGCGPGFCTTEMAYRVGQKGSVIGVDQSSSFLNHLENQIELQKLNVKLIHKDLHDFSIGKNIVDGAYCRWVLAWVENVNQILDNITPSIKPGGKFVFHEYFAWEDFKVSPSFEHLQHAVNKAFLSFTDNHGDVNIGRKLQAKLIARGFEIESISPISKMCRPNDPEWIWPESFLDIYLPKIKEKGYISSEELDLALSELRQMASLDHATIQCPTVIEIIAKKL